MSLSIDNTLSELYNDLTVLQRSLYSHNGPDDPNAKLELLVKILACYAAYKRGLITKFPHVDSTDPIKEICESIAQTASLSQYNRSSNVRVFGADPTDDIKSCDKEIIVQIIKLIRNTLDSLHPLYRAPKGIDYINEFFSYYICGNFKGNIDNAQYMTPSEVTDFIAGLALESINVSESNEPIKVLDPACGVGSFLTSIHKAYTRKYDPYSRQMLLYGQDKSDRMARLAAINLELLGVNQYSISNGDSLRLNTPLDKLNGRMDLILTNPPFRSKIPTNDIINHHFPLFRYSYINNSYIDSELLFIDRSLELLKDNGHLFIVLPSSLLTSKDKSISSLIHYLHREHHISSIIDLPSVTFAQAGTRTKTIILHIQKVKATDNSKIFMAVSKEIGFTVNHKKGSPVKLSDTLSDLPTINAKYNQHIANDDVGELFVDPMCVSIPYDSIDSHNWSPNHNSLKHTTKLESNDNFELTKLSDLVTFESSNRQLKHCDNNYACISIKHIHGEGILDINSVLNYKPKTKGFIVKPGDILISKINPRIPRICLVPKLDVQLLCSTEFEILRIKGDMDKYVLIYLLHSKLVQDQLTRITTGTSDSHSRIRTSELNNILIPVIKLDSLMHDSLEPVIIQYSNAMKLSMRSNIEIANIRQNENSIVR